MHVPLLDLNAQYAGIRSAGWCTTRCRLREPHFRVLDEQQVQVCVPGVVTSALHVVDAERRSSLGDYPLGGTGRRSHWARAGCDDDERALRVSSYDLPISPYRWAGREAPGHVDFRPPT